MAESTNLTTVTPSFITDALGGVWGLAPSLNQGCQVCYNGSIMAVTANVVLLLYYDHAVYQENASGNWYLYQSGGWVATTDPRLPVATESADGTTVTTVGPIIYASATTGSPDDNGPWNTFALTSNAQINMNNGTISGGNVLALIYHNHALFQHAAVSGVFDDWWYWKTQNTSWTEFRITAGPTLSATTYPANLAAGQTVATINTTMSDGSAFAGIFTVSDTVNFRISGNSLIANATLTASSHSFTITATPSMVGNAVTSPTITLTAQASTTPTIIGVSLSNASFIGGAASGTVVGTISVAMTGGTWSGTLALSGTNSSLFQIVGNNLVTNGVVAAGSYGITIEATQAGATGSPLSQPFAITASGSSNIPYVHYGTAPPATIPAVIGNQSPLGWSVGMFDDFTSWTESTSSDSASTGAATWVTNYGGGNPYCLYSPQQQQYYTNNHHTPGITPFTHAGSILNISAWNPQGSQLTQMRSAGSGQQSWATLASTLSSQGHNGPFISGSLYSADMWPSEIQQGYFELNCQLPFGISSNRGFWAAFWLFGGSEIDIFEQVGGSPDLMASTLHWNNYANNSGKSFNQSTNLTQGFHTYGCLWTPNYIAMYFDGKLQGDWSSSTFGSAFNQKMGMPINFAFGGGMDSNVFTSASELPTSLSTTTACMKIDWFRYSILGSQ